jgi:hypothetical protein
MAAGLALHRGLDRWKRVQWVLSDGEVIDDEIARLVIGHSCITGAGDSLFPEIGELSQTFQVRRSRNGGGAMKPVERKWPACEAVVVHLHPAWRCVCGRVLKGWDVILADDGASIPLRIVCSACDAALLTVERYQDTQGG